MHFCPRPSCRRFYHQKCLSSSSHPVHLLASSPDSDSTVILEDLIATSEPPKKRPRGRPSKSQAQDDQIAAVRRAEHFLGTLPPDLVLVAQQPIVRGAAFGAGGVVGNVRMVVQARRMVYEALQGTSLSEGWVEELGVRRAVFMKKPGKMPVFECPQCKGAI